MTTQKPPEVSTKHSLIEPPKFFHTIRLLYLLISSLSKKGPCFAHNEFLAKTINKSIRQVRRLLGELEEAGFIKIVRGKRTDDRQIFIRPENQKKFYTLNKLYLNTYFLKPKDTRVRTKKPKQKLSENSTNVKKYLKNLHVSTGACPVISPYSPYIDYYIINTCLDKERVRSCFSLLKKTSLSKSNCPSEDEKIAEKVPQKTADMARDTTRLRLSTPNNPRIVPKLSSKPSIRGLKAGTDGAFRLPQSMAGYLPYVRNWKAANEIRDLLKMPFRIGLSKFLMDPYDRRFFYGFTPQIVRDAISICHGMSTIGKKRISNIPAMLFKICLNLKTGKKLGGKLVRSSEDKLDIVQENARHAESLKQNISKKLAEMNANAQKSRNVNGDQSYDDEGLEYFEDVYDAESYEEIRRSRRGDAEGEIKFDISKTYVVISWGYGREKEIPLNSFTFKQEIDNALRCAGVAC